MTIGTKPLPRKVLKYQMPEVSFLSADCVNFPRCNILYLMKFRKKGYIWLKLTFSSIAINER
jgi:hypothetical protein